MQKISIKGKVKESTIKIESFFNNPQTFISSHTVIITDSKVKKLYGKFFPACPVIEIPAGEKSKNIATVIRIIENLLEIGVDRHWHILGIGGGVVTDIAGFVASIYMRGIDFSFIPTTLMAQADAAIGGKNGINIKNYKNIAGVINQPDFVICDTGFLKTLDKKEFLNGLAEVIKYAIISEPKMFEFLEQNQQKILNYDEECLNYLVYNSCKIKAEIVNKDESEKGLRKLLNFGHTIGHALEKEYSIPHGYAIAQGMIHASKLSAKLGLLNYTEYDRIFSIFSKYGYQTDKDVNVENIIDAIKKDKKKKIDVIEFVLINKIGNAIIKSIDIKELESFLK
ncbi:MAG: 3-dehydroquinate synthase [Marinilabiliales bacterium]